MGKNCGGCGKCCSSKGGNKNILQDLVTAKDYLSGAELAKKYNISRQALNKQINKLQDQGYEISAVSNLGYKLLSLPDRLDAVLIQSGLETSFIGRQIDCYDNVSSTQEICWHAGLNGDKEGFLAVSETQEAGKGRMNRTWVSGRGGLYFSLLLRPIFLTLRDVPKLTLVLGLAVYKGLKDFGVECDLKWPNDLLYQGKKICGILCELEADMDHIHFIAAGIGINVNNKDLPDTAISLARIRGESMPRMVVMQAILREIEKAYVSVRKDGFTSILQEWQKVSSMWGKTVSVKSGSKDIHGIAQGIDDEGRLIVKDQYGKIVKVHSGDIALHDKSPH